MDITCVICGEPQGRKRVTRLIPRLRISTYALRTYALRAPALRAHTRPARARARPTENRCTDTSIPQPKNRPWILARAARAGHLWNLKHALARTGER